MIDIIERMPTIEEYNNLLDLVCWGKRDDNTVKEAFFYIYKI